MKALFSEFSYGYALIEELVNSYLPGLSVAPIFPSLREEGSIGGGYDVSLNAGFPLFLQFKLSDCMKMKSVREVKDYNIYSETPFFRMHLRPLRHSKQHNLLLDLERIDSDNEVFYVTPAFHTSDEFNSNYLNHEIVENSVFIRPSTIGKLPNNDSHYVAFKFGDQIGYLFSKPKPVEPILLSDSFKNSLNQKMKSNELNLNIKMNTLKENLIYLLMKSNELLDVKLLNKVLEKSNIFEQIAYISRYYFDAQLIIVTQHNEFLNKHK